MAEPRSSPTFLHLCTALLRHSCDRGNNRRKVSPAISPSLVLSVYRRLQLFRERAEFPSWRAISENQRGVREDLAEFELLLCRISERSPRSRRKCLTCDSNRIHIVGRYPSNRSDGALPIAAALALFVVGMFRGCIDDRSGRNRIRSRLTAFVELRQTSRRRRISKPSVNSPTRTRRVRDTVSSRRACITRRQVRAAPLFPL